MFPYNQIYQSKILSDQCFVVFGKKLQRFLLKVKQGILGHIIQFQILLISQQLCIRRSYELFSGGKLCPEVRVLRQRRHRLQSVSPEITLITLRKLDEEKQKEKKSSADLIWQFIDYSGKQKYQIDISYNYDYKFHCIPQCSKKVRTPLKTKRLQFSATTYAICLKI